MLLNAKKLAFLGLLLAVTVLLIILSGVLEFNTIFLLAGASFCIGMAIRECGKRIGVGFYIASILLGLILAPNKLYCITYAAFGLYLVLIEYAYDKLLPVKNMNNRRKIFWGIKYLIFNLMYLPLIILLPRLVYEGEINRMLMAGIILIGQVALFIYDRAYDYYQSNIWEKIRGRLHL